eukprot:TCONS_00019121-protein
MDDNLRNKPASELAPKATHCGFLHKYNRKDKGQYRYCMVVSGCLIYYEKKSSKSPRKALNLVAGGYSLATHDNEYLFELRNPSFKDKSYRFSAGSEDEYTKWVDQLKAILNQADIVENKPFQSHADFFHTPTPKRRSYVSSPSISSTESFDTGTATEFHEATSPILKSAPHRRSTGTIQENYDHPPPPRPKHYSLTHPRRPAMNSPPPLPPEQRHPEPPPQMEYYVSMNERNPPSSPYVSMKEHNHFEEEYTDMGAPSNHPPHASPHLPH